MKNFLTYIILFFIGLQYGFSQSSLPAKLKFHNLSVEEGLPNNTINSIVQDSLGFIWIGTNDGLCRYDGKNYKSYKESLHVDNTISNNYVQSLYIDNIGILWVLTDQGLNRYNSIKDKFEIFEDENVGLSYNSVTKMVQDSKGLYYIGTYGGGLDVFDGTEFIKNYSEESLVALGSNLISDLELQADNTLWIGTYNNGISKIDLINDSITNLGFGQGFMSLSHRINELYLDQSGFLWVGTDQGLCVYNTLNGSFFNITKYNSKNFSDNDILSIIEDSEGTLWFGTRNAGILSASRKDLLANRERTEFQNYFPNGSAGSISHRSVSSLFEDKDGNIWIGTHQGGVNVVNPNGEALRYYENFGSGSDKEHQSVWGVCQGNQGKIWVGTDGDGLINFDPYTNKKLYYRHDPENPSSLSDDAILASLLDSKNNLWLGTYSGGINKMVTGTNSFKHYQKSTIPQSINSNDVRVIFEDSSARIWVGSNGGGLQMYNELSDDFEFIQDVGWLDIRVIAEDQYGVLWLGTFGNGLLSFDPATMEVKQYPQVSTYESHIIFSLYFTKDNALWIGTRYKGLLRFDPSENEIIQFTESEGLSNNTIQAVVGDQNDNLWISTNDGLNYLDTESYNFVQYKSNSGVQSGQFNTGSGFLSESGYLVFGGINGMNVFYPEKVIQKVNPFTILLTDFKLDNESVKVSTDSLPSPLLQSISASKSLELNHDQNDITLEYIALRYPLSDDIKYAYKLDNYDEKWNFVGNTLSATYRNLSPDEYVFQVKFVDAEGNLSKDSTSIRLNIAPPIWLTLPAIIFYIFILGLMIYFFVKYYTDQVKLRNSLFFEKKLRQKETELNKERFRFFTSFSHELRTPLTLILGPVKDMIKSEKNQKKLEKLSMVKRNSNVLLELINKMLEFRKTETEHNHLEVGMYSFNEFVLDIFKNFSFYARQKNIDFSFNGNVETLLWFDYKKIQLVINNILSNAFKFTPDGGKISIHIEDEPEWTLLIIKDSGLGIKKEALESIFDLYFHSDLDDVIDGTGIGLALCKNLIELHGGMIKADSIFGKGAIFTVFLNKNKAHYEQIENIKFLKSNDYTIKKPFLKSKTSQITRDKKELIEKDDRVILVIDDNQDVVEYVSGIMSDHYKILTAENGKEGIDVALKYIPDLIISDIMMPIKSGTELCEELKNRNQTSHIPIILLTAKLESENQLKSLNLGADAYITKPFDSEFLMARVENLFSNREKLIKHYQANSAADILEEGAHSIVENQFLKRLEEKINEHFDGKDIAVPELARELGFSRSSLYRKVKAITGLSINQFARKVRLNRAAQLIDKGNMNVSEVAFEVGFNDMKYFRSCFKEQFGLVPSVYRKRNLIKEDR